MSQVDSDEEEEWEQVFVENPNQEIEIIIPQPDKKKGITKRDRIIKLLQHKVHLLCMLSHTIYWNKWCNQELIHSILYSKFNWVIQPHKAQVKKLVYLWQTIPFDPNLDTNDDSSLLAAWEKPSLSLMAYCLYFVAQCRLMGLETRLVTLVPTISLSCSSKTIPPPPPRYLAEIYLDEQWHIVDPVSGFIGVQTTSAFPSLEHIGYVIACDTGGTIKDVSKRYLNDWEAVQKKLRIPPRPERMNDWWDLTLWLFSKSQTTAKDNREDYRLLQMDTSTKMPTSLHGFLNHPLYALEKQCKKYEMIYPNEKVHSIGVYKGQLVFPRSHVKKLASIEQWKRLGRSIAENEASVKTIKEKKRKREESNELLLFGEWQTVDYMAPSIVDVLAIDLGHHS